MILDFLARPWFFLDFLARLIAKILARNLRNPRFWQQMKKIQDLGKIFKIIQDYPRSWQENLDAKQWAGIIDLHAEVDYVFVSAHLFWEFWFLVGFKADDPKFPNAPRIFLLSRNSLNFYRFTNRRDFVSSDIGCSAATTMEWSFWNQLDFSR